MNLLQRYRSELDRNRILPDPAQRAVVELAQSLYDACRRAPGPAGRFSLRRWYNRRVGANAQAVTGLYLWGAVGCGKTLIVDMLYDCLPGPHKRRVHFHRYMQWVHAELKRLGQVANPLRVVARKLSGDVGVLCLDEFHVEDITDAMLLDGLLRCLFEQGITLIATSNEHPDQLYRDGLQRARFLPAIELIKQHTRVVRLDTGVDYRLRYLQQADVYHYPGDARDDAKLLAHFQAMTREAGQVDVEIEILGRAVKAKRLAAGVVWFMFAEICSAPRGVADYIEIARQFQTVLLQGVPQLDDAGNDQAKRFITMLDEYYDRNVKLIITAAAAPHQLYTGQRLAQVYQRTASRLIEMQSHDYLARPHRA